MWGYSCGAAVTGSTATCATLNPSASGGWSPVVITVPTGTDLTINLTNNLSFAAGAGTNIPTSLVIVGQLGGGLGSTARTSTPSPGPRQRPATPPGRSPAPAPQTSRRRRRGPACSRSATEVAAGRDNAR